MGNSYEICQQYGLMKGKTTSGKGLGTCRKFMKKVR